jgi:hypothetical protein
LARDATHGGRDIIEKWLAIANDSPALTERYVVEIPQEGKTKEGLPRASKFITRVRPAPATRAEQTEALKCLADRGWGKAPLTVQLDEQEAVGFQVVHRIWEPGVDPLMHLDRMNQERVIDGKAKALPEPPPPSTNGHGNGNGHKP